MSWKVRLDDDWGITSDKRQYRLCKIGNIKNKETDKIEENWSPERYCDSLSRVLINYREIKIRKGDIKKLEEVVDLINKVDKKIQKVNEKLGI